MAHPSCRCCLAGAKGSTARIGFTREKLFRSVLRSCISREQDKHAQRPSTIAVFNVHQSNFKPRVRHGGLTSGLDSLAI